MNSDENEDIGLTDPEDVENIEALRPAARAARPWGDEQSSLVN
jgi:hypothetical protein